MRMKEIVMTIISKTIGQFCNMICSIYTVGWISQLPADHLSIIIIPVVITNSAPLSSRTYLHPTSMRANILSMNQPEITIAANTYDIISIFDNNVNTLNHALKMDLTVLIALRLHHQSINSLMGKVTQHV